MARSAGALPPLRVDRAVDSDRDRTRTFTRVACPVSRSHRRYNPTRPTLHTQDTDISPLRTSHHSKRLQYYHLYTMDTTSIVPCTEHKSQRTYSSKESLTYLRSISVSHEPPVVPERRVPQTFGRQYHMSLDVFLSFWRCPKHPNIPPFSISVPRFYLIWYPRDYVRLREITGY